MSIKVTIDGTGVGIDALTGKEGDGLTVTFENEGPTFLSWKSWRLLTTMKTSQAKPQLKPAAIPMAPPANGPVAVK